MLSKTDDLSSIKQIIFEFNDDLPIGSNDYCPATAPEYAKPGRLLATGVLMDSDMMCKEPMELVTDDLEGKLSHDVP